MIKQLLLPVFVLLAGSFAAQVNVPANRLMAGKIKSLYNEKKYGDIYSMLGTELKKAMPEKEFCDFMQKNIFAYHGTVENFEHLKDETDHSEFIGNYTNGQLLLKLNVDSTGHVKLMQFLPHIGMPKTKITGYASDNSKTNKLDSLIDKVVTDYMQSPQNCGLSIGIYNNGKEYFYNYGETKRNTRILADPQTIYEIGSVTKTFCGVLLAVAISEGKVKETDDIRLYLPAGKFKNLAANGNYIQLVHLANHTSGLPRLPQNLEDQPGYDPFNPYNHYTTEMLYNYLSTISLVSEPGALCEYSNLGMGLLGIILENIYGKSFEELVKEKICTPFAMKSTAINLTTQQQQQFASGYNANGNETPHWDLPSLTAAGGLRSSTRDMLAFAKNNLEEKEPALKLSHQSTFNYGSNVGMAWQILKTKSGNTLFWHNGATFGSSAFCGFIKEKNCAVVVLSNSSTSVDPIALAILKFLQQ
jgi:CubicO group peptidase (beta-lactamase class C family)